MGIPMQALARQNYGGRALMAGEDFTAPNDAEADDLEAVRMAKRKTPKVKKQEKPANKQPMRNRMVDPTRAPAVTDTPADGPTAPTGGNRTATRRDTYSRRDVRAQDSVAGPKLEGAADAAESNQDE